MSVAERHACPVLGQPRSPQRYQAQARRDEAALTEAMVRLARKDGRDGYRQITAMLQAEGWRVKHKQVDWMWRQEGVKVPKKQPQRRRLWVQDGSCIRRRPQHRNHVWAYDVVAARTHEGRPLRLLTIVDEYTRACLAIEVARSRRADAVMVRLTELCVQHGPPAYLRSDNGPEFTAKAIRQWLTQVGGKLCSSSLAALGRRALMRVTVEHDGMNC